MGEQQSYYRENEEYAEFLEGWDPGFYAKYADTLCPDEPGGKALDVGCGVGQVVQRLMDAGHEAHGVEVSGPNIEKARRISERCQLYDGRTLPFGDTSFDSIGALNVLEHVEEPEAFLAELVRVTKPGGKVVISSPNFFRALGLMRLPSPHARPRQQVAQLAAAPGQAPADGGRSSNRCASTGWSRSAVSRSSRTTTRSSPRTASR